MSYRVDSENGQATIFLEGEIDLDQSPGARAVLLDCVSKHQVVMVNMAAVEYIDSSGIASLVEALQQARKREVEFHLCEVSQATDKVLALARLNKVFSIR